MSKMSAKSAAEFIKIHVKAGNKRVPTVGSKELSVEDRVARQDEEFFDSIKAAEEEQSSLPVKYFIKFVLPADFFLTDFSISSFVINPLKCPLCRLL